MPAAAEPPSRDAADLGLLEAAALLRSRRLSAAELLAACLARIEARNGGAPSFDGAPGAINAWVRLYPEHALELARAADERLDRERADAPLVCGIPIALKDLYARRRPAAHRVEPRARRRAGRRGLRAVGAAARARDGAGRAHPHARVRRRRDDRPGRQSVGAATARPAARAAARRRRWRRGWCRRRSAPTRSARCASRRRCAARARSSPPTGGCRCAGVIPLAPTLDHAGPMARTIADCSALLAAMAADGPEVSPLLPPPAPLAGLAVAPRAGPRPLEG